MVLLKLFFYKRYNFGTLIHLAVQLNAATTFDLVFISNFLKQIH